MLTKRDKLLIRPWIDQRYENHRRKVQSASPVIDFHSPTIHPHVTLKLKKAQKENERKEQIKKENIRLLQKLGSIMTTKRLENIWTSPRPNFLNRVYLYNIRPKTSPNVRSSQTSITDKEIVPLLDLKGAYARCSACSGKSIKRNQVIPEERIPFPPVKQTINQKILNELKTNKHKCCKFCCC